MTNDWLTEQVLATLMGWESKLDADRITCERISPNNEITFTYDAEGDGSLIIDVTIEVKTCLVWG